MIILRWGIDAAIISKIVGHRIISMIIDYLDYYLEFIVCLGCYEGDKNSSVTFSSPQKSHWIIIIEIKLG